MAITLVIEQDLNGQRTLTESLGGGHVGKRTFLAFSDDVADTEATVLAHASIPSLGQLFPGSSIVYCTSRTPTRVPKTQKQWLVECEYKSDLNQQEIDRISAPSPLDRTTVVSGTFRTIMQPARRCLRTGFYNLWIDGTTDTFDFLLSANSANDPLDPPVSVAVSEAELRFSKHVEELPTWFTDVSLGYHNGVNDDDQAFEILGVSYTLAKGTAKLGNFAFSEAKRQNGVDFVTLTWSVNVKTPREELAGETGTPGPWDEERLDEGMRRLTAEGSGSFNYKWENIRDITGQSVMLPVPFNGAGDKINSDGTAIPENLLKYACYRPFGNRVDFSVIPWT